MKAAIVCIIGLAGSWGHAAAEPLVEGRVRLDSGQPVPGAQVLLFDLSDLRAAPLAATTDRSGHFTLPLATLAGPLPERFELGANYPNPFNPSTMIPYQLPAPMHVRLEVFNILGQRIATLVDGERSAGFHTTSWDATDAAGEAVGAGVYLYRLSADGVQATRSMLLIDGQAGIPSGGGGSTGSGGEAGAGKDGETAPVYGLAVSGPGLVPYVDPAFRMEAGMAPLDLVVEAPGSVPPAKVASGGILGDVDNTGGVDFFDALLVALYSRDSSIVMPNHGDITLGDVNADGQIDLADAWLIAAYLNDSSDPALPSGIGEPVAAATASLSPDPSTMTFADDGAWHRFTVEAGEPVSVVANPGADSPRLEITTRSGRGNYCPAEADDDVARGDGQTLYLAGCSTGPATVELRRESDGTVLRTYTFEVTGSPADLVVESVSVSDSTLTPGQSFTLSATVRNQGTGGADATTLRYYRSTNRTISTRDTRVGTDGVSALGASRTSAESISLTAPSSAGTYYYGACVVNVAGESAGNNCSAGVRVRIEAGSPDLIVESVSVSNSNLTTGESFTLNATVRNQGTGAAAATTLRYYRSTNATISTRDTEVGTDAVGALAAEGTGAESVDLTAPSTEGTYYYGACVGSVTGESNTRNNCSSGVAIVVGAATEDVGTGGDSGTGERGYFLLIKSAEVSDSSLMAGQSFTLKTTVQNMLSSDFSTPIGLYFFRSTDATLDKADAFLERTRITNLKAGATQTVSLDWTAPPYAGTYYYGACTGWWAGWNCSAGVRVGVEGGEDGRPDVSVQTPSVSHDRLAPGGKFTLRVTVENVGSGPTSPTTIRPYRSDDASIDATDTELGESLPLSLPRREAGGEWRFTWDLDVLFEAGTYYYGVCASPPVPGETNTDNNCSVGVPVIAEAGERGSPDLIVLDLWLRDRSPSDIFVITAWIGNTGTGAAPANVRFYRSDDETIDATDTLLDTSRVEQFAVGVTRPKTSYYITAPTSPGTYYYGACVDPVADESDTDNNCSVAVPMNVGVPDLAVGLAWVSTSAPLAGQPLTLTATVRNQGPDQAASTTLRYYRSDDATIDATDTPIGTDAVSSLTGFDGPVSGPESRLADSGTSRQSISVNAPSSPGRYYYGACADAVPDESNTDNNCSVGAYVRVVPFGEDPFNIELVFLSDFTDAHTDLFQQAARRWETIITDGLQDIDFSLNPYKSDETNVVDDIVDDLRVFIDASSIIDNSESVAGRGGPLYLRDGNPVGLPALGRVSVYKGYLSTLQEEETLGQEERLLRDLMVHEIAHVLGFGPLWNEFDLRHELSGDTYFSGERAIQAFNAAGGETYSGNKVPVEFGSFSCGVPSHWNDYVFRGHDRLFGAEIMEPNIQMGHAISAVTIQSLADLGYVVDVSRADPYRLPASVSTARPPTASAKPVASYGDFDLEALGTIYVGDEQGRISHTIRSD